MEQTITSANHQRYRKPRPTTTSSGHHLNPSSTKQPNSTKIQIFRLFASSSRQILPFYLSRISRLIMGNIKYFSNSGRHSNYSPIFGVHHKFSSSLILEDNFLINILSNSLKQFLNYFSKTYLLLVLPLHINRLLR